MFDSLTLTHSLTSHIWFQGKPLNYTLDEAEGSQLLPPIKIISYGLSLIKRESIFKTKNMIGESPDFYEFGLIESWDIDSLEDFKIAESIFNTGINGI